LYFKIDVTEAGSDTNATDATLLAIVYNGKVYDSVKSFRAAWSAPGFVKLPLAVDGDWTTMDQAGEPFPFDTEPGPQIVNPSKRYALDSKNMYIEWMGFSFYMGVSELLGLGLYNVNYEKERIIYELRKYLRRSTLAGS
jgi:primary-amine oxidase